jgi:formylglycine-generating enzyme required for sulfatase activity
MRLAALPVRPADLGGDADQEQEPAARLLVAVHPVTQAQFERVMGYQPSTRFRNSAAVGPDHPVFSVSRFGSGFFCRALSALLAEREAGRRYRLPTAAEWLLLHRVGRDTGTPPTPDRLPSPSPSSPPFPDLFRPAARPVGSGVPNPLGLFDLHDNVGEWCDEMYEDADPDDPSWQREWACLCGLGETRDGSKPSVRYALAGGHYPNVGFRVVCVESASRV